MREEIKVLEQFDKDQSKWLDTDERKAAREHLSQQPRQRAFGPGGRGGGRGGPWGRNENLPAPTPGAKLSSSDVPSAGEAPLYASNVLRTLFLEFESAEWEKELEDFHGTDVDVPAKLTVDGKTFAGVGVHFRGNTSYMMVGTGWKRPLNLSLDMTDKELSLLGYRTLNLLNGHEDPTFLHTVLSLQIARDYFPAPLANYVRLAINNENWGVYINVEQFNKDFVKRWFNTTKGARWKVPGSPGGRGGLEYLGDDAADYRRIYEIKTKDDSKSWSRLIELCRVLDQTTTQELEQALAPLLDIDSTLRFLAWDNALSSGDGFWTRASDYSLYLDEQGRFHLFPYDVNETFSTGRGPEVSRDPAVREVRGCLSVRSCSRRPMPIRTAGYGFGV
jgi:spore coat protein CotH